MEPVKEALLRALDKLASIESAYSVAARDAVGKEVGYRDLEREREETENFHRSEIIALGLPGSNETARQAALRVALDANRYVHAAREAARLQQDARDHAAAELRIWDVRQKVARAEVAALTALVNGG